MFDLCSSTRPCKLCESSTEERSLRCLPSRLLANAASESTRGAMAVVDLVSPDGCVQDFAPKSWPTSSRASSFPSGYTFCSTTYTPLAIGPQQTCRIAWRKLLRLVAPEASPEATIASSSRTQSRDVISLLTSSGVLRWRLAPRSHLDALAMGTMLAGAPNLPEKPLPQRALVASRHATTERMDHYSPSIDLTPAWLAKNDVLQTMQRCM